MTDTRGDTNTNTNVFANSKNLSPNNSSVNRLDKVTAQSSKEDENQPNAVVKPSTFVQPGGVSKQINYPLTAQK